MVNCASGSRNLFTVFSLIKIDFVFKGIHEDIRREAWKFLLGYYDFKSTYEERVKMKEIKK